MLLFFHYELQYFKHSVLNQNSRLLSAGSLFTTGVATADRLREASVIPPSPSPILSITFELWLIINNYQLMWVIRDTTAGEYCSSFGYNSRFSWYFMSMSLSLKFLLSPFPNLFFFNSVRFSWRSKVGESITTWEKRRELCWESFTPDDCYQVQKIVT